MRSTASAGSRSNPSSKASPRRLDAPRRVISPAVSNVYFGSSGQGADQVVAKPRPLRISSSAPKPSEIFRWTSPAKRALVVETDRQTDLCSEHALTPGFSSGLVAVQVPDLGHRMGGQWWIPRVTGLLTTPKHQAPTRKGRPRSRQSCRLLKASALMNCVTNGGGFTAASRQRLVATC